LAAAATSERLRDSTQSKLALVLLTLFALGCGAYALAAGPIPLSARAHLFASRRNLLYGELTMADWVAITDRMEHEPGATAPSPESQCWKQANRQRQAGDLSSARATLHAIIGLPAIETPAVLIAWRALRNLGELPDPSVAREILGVVVEFAEDEESATIPIVVAAYAREAPQLVASNGFAVLGQGTMPATVDGAAKKLMAAVEPISGRFGLQEKPKMPKYSMVQFALLTPGGIRVTEAPLAAAKREHDPMHSPFQAAIELVKAMMTEGQRVRNSRH
jgi:hypothetical protein